ncbi:MAG: DUF4214 domain-containing protein [Clostridia bacterium]|nr:DUF4214 domain-containing protein [Clostridia bacterium]
MESNRFVKIVYILLVTLIIGIFTPYSKVSANEIGAAGFVRRCYRIALGREADEEGFQYWMDKLFSGEACGVSVAYGFVYSPEFQNAGFDDSTYVDKMYNMLLGREPDKDGKDYWVNNLNSGYTRYDIFIGFANSEEFYNLCKSYGIFSGYYISGSDMNRVNLINSFVDRLYGICFKRKGDQGGQSTWVLELASNRISGLVASYGFLFSNEYLDLNTGNEEFVRNLYSVFFGREPDKSGFDSWVGKLNSGEIAREDALMGFAKSIEFNNLCLAYGINAGTETYEGITFTPVNINNPTNTPTSSPTTVTVTPTYIPTITAEPTYPVKTTPDFSVPYIDVDGKTYTVKSYQIDINQEFLKVYHEHFVTRTDFTYDGVQYNLSNTYDSDYGLPIDLECDGTVYGFFLDDVSNELNQMVNEYRRENGWEEYAIIDYELCRLRAIEGTVGRFELGHYLTRGGAGGSQNMAWSFGINDANFFYGQYYKSSGHLAKWKGKGALNMATSTFVRVEWIPDSSVEDGGYWSLDCVCNDQMFISNMNMFSAWGTFEVYTGMNSLLHDEDFDAYYNYFITQGNAQNNHDMFTHLKKEDI